MLENITIIYEDDNLVAINKPAGLMVHPDGHSSDLTVVDWMIARYAEAHEVGEPQKLSTGEMIARPGVVHRLDRDTSGILILAKTQKSFLFLKNKFQSRELKKTYNAIVYGDIKADTGTIDLPIGRSAKDFRLRSAEHGARGEMRDAVTDYKVLARAEATGKGYTYLELYPKTGRTHQLRVHLKALQHPIVCDKLYAPKRECLPGLGRVALHARMIEFTGQGRKKLKLEAPPPDDFRGAVEQLFGEFAK